MKRIKHILSALLFIVALAQGVNAQSVVLCESYDTGGNPTGIYTSWEIKSTGGYVYILYRQPGVLGSGTWYLYLDYDWDDNGKYSAYETLSFTPEEGKNWSVYDFKFTESGKYKAIIMKDGVELASTYFEITMQPGAATDSEEEVDTYYYEDSEILFCTSVDSVGNPSGTSTRFSLGASGTANVVVYLSNNYKAFKTTKMYVDVYSSATNEKVDDFSIDVEADWDFVKFTQPFTNTGDFYIDIYNADDVFINTATVTIIR